MFKRLAAPVVILTDIDMSKRYHRDLLIAGHIARAIGLRCLKIRRWVDDGRAALHRGVLTRSQNEEEWRKR